MIIFVLNKSAIIQSEQISLDIVIDVICKVTQHDNIWRVFNAFVLQKDKGFRRAEPGNTCIDHLGIDATVSQVTLNDRRVGLVLMTFKAFSMGVSKADDSQRPGWLAIGVFCV